MGPENLIGHSILFNYLYQLLFVVLIANAYKLCPSCYPICIPQRLHTINVGYFYPKLPMQIMTRVLFCDSIIMLPHALIVPDSTLNLLEICDTSCTLQID